MRTLRYAGLLSLAAFGLLAGCGRHSNKETYYLISNNLALPYWKTAIAGFQKAAAQYDVTAKVDGPNNYDAQAELKDLHDAIATHPNGILVSVADAALMQPEIDAAIDQNIPVIIFDSPIDTDKFTAQVATDNYAGGQLGAARIAEILKGKGKVAEVAVQAGSASTMAREQAEHFCPEKPNAAWATPSTAASTLASASTMKEACWTWQRVAPSRSLTGSVR